jgi:gliding motility-associated-like protein
LILDYKFDTVLNAVAPSVGNGYWSYNDLNSSISDTLLNNTSVTLEQVGTYKFIWTVENGSCTTLNDSVFVTVGDLKVFSGFSPNGDEYNQFFVLELSGKNTAELTILDVNGGIVFTTSGKDQIQWDGTTNSGKEIPEGTYFYIIREPGVSDRTGFIELRR